MFEELAEIARNAIELWKEIEPNVTPGATRSWQFGEYSMTLHRDNPEKVFIPAENLAGIAWAEEPEAVSA
jgi:hypothetical protein